MLVLLCLLCFSSRQAKKLPQTFELFIFKVVPVPSATLSLIASQTAYNHHSFNLHSVMVKIDTSVEKITADVKAAFDTVREMFAHPSPMGDSHPSDSSLAGANRIFSNMCVSACGIQDLIGELSFMRGSLHRLQLSLVTLEYCLVALTVIIGAATVLALIAGLIYFCVRLRSAYCGGDNKSSTSCIFCTNNQDYLSREALPDMEKKLANRPLPTPRNVYNNLEKS